MADINLYRNTDNDIAISLVNISDVTSMSVSLIRKDSGITTLITSVSGKIALSPTEAVLRIDKELITIKGIYYMEITVVSGSSTRGLKPTPDFITVI